MRTALKEHSEIPTVNKSKLPGAFAELQSLVVQHELEIKVWTSPKFSERLTHRSGKAQPLKLTS